MSLIIFLKSLFTNQNPPVVVRLAISIVFISIVISVISTSLLIYSNYQESDKQFAAQLNEVKKNNLPALTNALWYFDQMQINTQGDWISSLPHIDYVKIATKRETFFEKGSLANITASDHISIPLIYNNKTMGKLELGFSRETSLVDLIQPVGKAIALQLISIVLLTLFLIWGVHRFITRQLQLKDKVQTELTTSNHQLKQIVNERTLSLQTALDELNSFSDSIN